MPIVDFRLPIDLFRHWLVGNRHLEIGNLESYPLPAAVTDLMTRCEQFPEHPKIVDKNQGFRLVYQPKIRFDARLWAAVFAAYPALHNPGVVL